MGRPKLQASLLVALSATAAVVAGCAGASDVCGQPETATPWMVRPVLSEDKSCLLSISPDSVLVADRGGDMCSGAGIGYRVGPAIEPTPEIDATDGGVRIPVTAATSAMRDSSLVIAGTTVVAEYHPGVEQDGFLLFECLPNSVWQLSEG